MLQILRCVNITTRCGLKILPAIEGEIICRRWAGHSKWANIRHQKGSTDLERNKLFTRLIRMMKVAIAEGASPDPVRNLKLAQVLEQCKRANMPSSTITNAIKSSSSAKSNESSKILHIRGPGRSSIIVEIIAANTAIISNDIASVMKKSGCKYDKSAVHDFIEKGSLICSPLPTSTNILDDAMDHAIISYVEEVTYDDELKKLTFECSPEALWKAKKSLETIGYVVDSAIVEFIPEIRASPSETELVALNKFFTKVDAMPEVVSIIDNIE